MFLRYIDPNLDALLRSWPYPARYLTAVATRENYYCLFCRRNFRIRMLASVIARHMSGAVVYEAGSTTILAARLLRAARRWEVSEYMDGALPGDIVGGIRHEDLQRLTWPSSSFDMVVTTEVFEHIDDPWRAFSEVRRVLRPGGRHVFTVPDHDDASTSSRKSLPTVLHLDGLRPEGVAVRTDFGTDLPALLTAHGFRTTIHAFPGEEPVTRVYESVAV